MLSEIINIPVHILAPTDRRVALTSQDLLRQIEPSPYFNGRDGDTVDILLGGLVQRQPYNVKKAIYVALDGSCAFEVVFYDDLGKMRCLYTKIIAPRETEIGISYEGIRPFRDGDMDHGKSLATIISEINWMRTTRITSDDLQLIIAPIYHREMLDAEVVAINEFDHEDLFYNGVFDRWRPLFVHEPSVLEAMMRGTFLKAPQMEARTPNPFLLPTRVKPIFYPADGLVMSNPNGVFYNHDAFDVLATRIMRLRIPEFSIMLSFDAIVEGHIVQSVMDHYHDIYEYLLSTQGIIRSSIYNTLSSIFQEALYTYTRLFDVDLYSEHRCSRIDQSIVTIRKNLYDEILIEFHDRADNRKIQFYTSFPILAMATQGAGRFLKHR